MGKIDELKSDFDIALKAVELTKIALSGDQSKSARKMRAGLDKYSKNAQKASNLLSKASTAVNIVEAASNIKDMAMYLTVTKAENRIPAVEAYMYGKLFATAGKIVQFLPYPARIYGDILVGAEHFFSDMWDITNPESVFTPRGRMMKELSDLDKKHIVEKGDPCTFTLNYDACRRNLTN